MSYFLLLKSFKFRLPKHDFWLQRFFSESLGCCGEDICIFLKSVNPMSPEISIKKNHELVAVLEGHKGAVTSVVFTEDGRTFASASWDKTVRIWNGLVILDWGTYGLVVGFLSIFFSWGKKGRETLLCICRTDSCCTFLPNTLLL